MRALDVITDFVHGKDKIDLSKIDANTHKAGNQAFEAGYLSTIKDTTGGRPTVIVLVDVNDDNIKDLAIKVVGVSTVFTTDFVL